MKMFLYYKGSNRLKRLFIEQGENKIKFKVQFMKLQRFEGSGVREEEGGGG